MHTFTQRLFLKKSAPERAERLYRQMLARREAKKREAVWQKIAMQFPKMH